MSRGVGVEEDVLIENNLIFFQGCKACKYSLNSTSMKVVIENCKDTCININGSILTSIIEIINSDNIILNVNKSTAYTIQVDKCNGVHINIAKKSQFCNLITSKVEDITIEVEGEQHVVPKLQMFDQEVNPDISQIITHYVNYKIVSELIIREGEGYISTKRLQEEQKEESIRTGKAIEKYLSQVITFKGKDDKKDDKNDNTEKDKK